jgi:hypothetical protein
MRDAESASARSTADDAEQLDKESLSCCGSGTTEALLRHRYELAAYRAPVDVRRLLEDPRDRHASL